MGNQKQIAKGSRKEVELRHRINAAKVSLTNQIGFFRSQFGNVSSDWKEDDTRVTFADFAVSEKIFAELRSSFPKDDYCTEEANPFDEVQELNAEYAWVLDPIDGTNNYYLGIPTCAISLAILRNGFPVYGLIYDFALDALLHGGPEHGIMQDNRRLEPVWQSLDPKRSVAAFHFPLEHEDLERLRPWLEHYRVRGFGSAALNLSYAAVAKLEGCVDFKVKVWDIAAAYALISAAGGVFHFNGESPFPLKAFQAQMPNLRCWAGSEEFCNFIAELFPAGVSSI
ncbi:inositol monophosphatase family protein [Rubellicoccus peritrichatus]|uniref:Inositol monophosphatase family protein n=1 Tax=Rubellicoccus peritrichatus TaxID=3080537 RepID=A0AAQ3QXA8_9BACT|nr:inositol monophosphatase family protein [Puniceicoccus sp. CR14]WOO42842.1 inositol monophosphatase family protein [Puniceicoccus sp. CR14]